MKILRKITRGKSVTLVGFVIRILVPVTVFVEMENGNQQQSRTDQLSVSQQLYGLTLALLSIYFEINKTTLK